MSTKQSIPVQLKNNVWSRKFQDNATGLCSCCQKETLQSSSFHCGHIYAEAQGGEIHILNMLPICKSCNIHMGQQYMPNYMERVFGRNLFNEMDVEMMSYQHKIKNVVDYESKVPYDAKRTPEAFLEPIEHVFEYLIEDRGYMDPLWTEETYKEYVSNIKIDKSGDKPNHVMSNVSIDGIRWKYIYISYMNEFVEMKFTFIRESTDDFPDYSWEGWVYLQKCSSYRKLSKYPMYIDGHRNRAI